jgi:hypothetical protein
MGLLRGVRRRVLAGAVAGAVGTVAMDAVWYVRHRRSGGSDGPLAWEFAQGTSSWDEVSAPGKVGRHLLTRVTGHDVADRWARPTQNAVHWLTGIGWGAQLGLVTVTRLVHPGVRTGLRTGVVAWLTSYAVLPRLGIYQPIWEYDATTLGKDLSAHLAFGATTGCALRVLAGR